MSNKKDLKAWLERMSSDKEFSKKFEGLNTEKEIVTLAKKEGYNFTETELADLKMEAVSGGASEVGMMFANLGMNILEQAAGTAIGLTGSYLDNKMNSSFSNSSNKKSKKNKY